ncbi:orotate phosphoribosyltransferase [uncultured Jatrophihabitans sp.]|uniref:orotate phosphoribosyltransferase n=1 Tax=uncultured Jatrophihabitans sp. TaxID=1610747 RepID=UPI0035CAA499
MSALRDDVIAIVKQHGLEYREEPFLLASGELSHDYMDGKKALAEGANLRRACEAILELAQDAGVQFDAVGGLTLGADAYATGIALLAQKRWFVVRKQPKDHGKGKRIEGAELAPGTRVLLVDDVVSTGGSILEALEVVQETGADIVLAVTLVDRGDEAEGRFRALGVPYRPLITYRDLGIKPVGKITAAATG